ncbi:hypothetical protein EVJ58_g3711 [Rhodofomes roseus]|uniref:ADF-H domain-containing protein n=1 Tax=Rhodofomes roseus TaxID=34475 RepID=A0A4Y9YMH3_9APHY|nr:hypothetical protein EVJ58_g3711 [Rhodofomes roseus]
MADVSDPKIDEAYLDVRSDKTETNWLLSDYESDRSDKLTLTATGSGGLEELREHLDESKASFAYARVQYANDKESKREKFIFIVWIGPNCKVMRKAKISVHAADVKQVLRVYSLEVPAREKDDLKEEPIIVRLRKAGGASYDGIRHYPKTDLMPMQHLRFWRRNRSRRTPIALAALFLRSRIPSDINLASDLLELAELADKLPQLPLFGTMGLEAADLAPINAVMAPTTAAVLQLRGIREAAEEMEMRREARERGRKYGLPDLLTGGSVRRRFFNGYKYEKSNWKMVSRRTVQSIPKAVMQAQRPYMQQRASQVFPMGWLLQKTLGLSLEVCWRILDMAEYWVQMNLTYPPSPSRLQQNSIAERMPVITVTMYHMDTPGEAGSFKRLRRVRLAVGRHNMDGDLPYKHVVSTSSYSKSRWPEDALPVHIFQWDHRPNGNAKDDQKKRRVFDGVRPNDRLTVDVTASKCYGHVDLLRVELFYSCM